MARARFAAVARRIRQEKSLKYIGVVNIRLDDLWFPNSEGPDKKNVKRLVKLFQGQRGCSPGDTQNRIPAIIREADLQNALALSNLSREELLASSDSFARLNFSSGFRLECLRGEDRVQAAREVLNGEEPRWVVDLYAAGRFYKSLVRRTTDKVQTSATRRNGTWQKSMPVRRHQPTENSISKYGNTRACLGKRTRVAKIHGRHA